MESKYGQDEGLILKTLKTNKLSKGSYLMMESEKLHAQEAIESGIYVTWGALNSECFRIGSNSICICAHSFNTHEKTVTRKKLSSKCKDCKCKAFSYIPTLPEEIGEYWIPYQPKFDYSKWKAKCKCAHGWNQHSVERFLKCGSCNCFSFSSNFCCVVCDKFWQDHQMSYELEHDRLMLNKPIRQDFLPFNSMPELYKSIYK